MAKIRGFFTEAQLDSVGIDGPGSGKCSECGLNVGCKTPQMGYTGQGGKGILIVSEAPSEADDLSGAPLMGDTGKWFREKLRAKGIDLDKDCWKTNVVCCHPANQKDKKPTLNQVKNCRPRLMKTMEELKPKFIWLMGSDAIYSYYHERETNSSPMLWRGLCIPDIELNAWILPMYHPQYAIRMEKDDHFVSTYMRDLTFAINQSKRTDSPVAIPIDGAKIVKRYEDVITILERIVKEEPEVIAFDYETTGLKPYRRKHKIASCSIALSETEAYGFPYMYRTHFTPEQIEHIGDLCIEIMSNPKIGKVIQNSKFEDAWTREMFGIEPAHIIYCTMNAVHTLDTRKYFSGLKFQALVRWGVPDYDKDISKYLESYNNPYYNRVMEIPINDLLLYCAMDSLLTFRLYKELKEEYRRLPKVEQGRLLILKSLTTFCDMQENGIRLDNDYYVEQDRIIGDKIEKLRQSLYQMPEAKKFEQVKRRPINFGSNSDLSELFFDILKLDSSKTTKGGNKSVDAEVMAALNSPLAKEITKISKLEKIKGTYLAQFLREIEEDGRLRPFFDLHTTTTLRGSSSNPNFQNIPVRDLEAMNITRGGIMPSFGNQLIDWDYGSMEVRIIACYTQDPELIYYIEDPTTDMHRDQAMDLFCFTQSEWEELTNLNKRWAKDIRFQGKNGFVFAEFYGSYFKSIAKGLFPILKDLPCFDYNVFEHLRSKGVIRSLNSAYDDVENHFKKVEQRFWNRFKKVKEWQERSFKLYLEKGYIEQMHGFRLNGWLTRNDICNWPVQGTAFHCLLWSLNTLRDRMIEMRMRSKLIGQIHDCCLGDINPSEHLDWCRMSQQIATKEIREAHPWIIVPLSIEFEGTGIDKPWSTKKEFFID